SSSSNAWRSTSVATFLRRLTKRLERLKSRLRDRRDYGSYQSDPVGYCRDVLRVQLTPEQGAILRALRAPPYRVLVKSAHSVGKTFLAAAAVNWWFDCFDPSAAITTAPTERDVVDLLWTEIRLQRGRAGLLGPMRPKAPLMETGPDHYAKGYTARTG